LTITKNNEIHHYLKKIIFYEFKKFIKNKTHNFKKYPKKQTKNLITNPIKKNNS